MILSNISIFVLLTVSATVLSLPNQLEPSEVEEKKSELTCAEGEIIAEGNCVPAVQFYSAVPPVKPVQGTDVVAQKPVAGKPVQDNDKIAKKQKRKALKKKKLKKQLDKEIKEIKRLVLEGLDKGNVNITDITCQQGEEIDLEGQCVPVSNATAVDPKKVKMQKKLEKELEIVLKKEIQNELKRKRRIKKRKQVKTSPETGSKNVTTVTSPEKERSEQVVLIQEDLPLCTEDNQQDCRQPEAALSNQMEVRNEAT